MKHLTLVLLSLAIAGAPLRAATCTGASDCRACKNCKYCKLCSKEGGSCGVCSKRSAAVKPAPRTMNAMKCCATKVRK